MDVYSVMGLSTTVLAFAAGVIVGLLPCALLLYVRYRDHREHPPLPTRAKRREIV